MTQTAPNPYLRTQVMTATPHQLRLMLYDGALKFARQARSALDGGRFEESYNNLVRAQKIVLELSTSLKHNVDPDLCGKLSALYTYIYRRLVEANVSRDTGIIDEAIRLIDYERETWQMLMQKLGQQATAPEATAVATPSARPAPNPYASPSRLTAGYVRSA